MGDIVTRFQSAFLFSIAAATVSVIAGTAARATGSDIPPAKPLPATSVTCIDSKRPVGGFKGYTIPIANILFGAQEAQADAATNESGFLSPDFFDALGEDSGKGQSQNASTITKLMEAFYNIHSDIPRNANGTVPAEPLKATGLGGTDEDGKILLPDEAMQKQNRLAANVYNSVLHYLDNPILNTENTNLFVIDPNGAAMGTADWKIAIQADPPFKRYDRANWLLWQLAAGENYQIGCIVDASKQGAGASGEQADTGREQHVNPPYKASSYHVGGERDDLALSSFGLSDPLATSPTFSVQPGSAHGGHGSGNSYNFTAQGAVGYTVLESDCTYEKFPVQDCRSPWTLTLFADAFYGQDKNAPKSMGSSGPVIDRVGTGVDFAIRLDPLFEPRKDAGSDVDGLSGAGQHRLGLLVQVIPELVTDTHFEAKTFYGELRADVVDVPYLPCTGSSTVPFPGAGFQFKCGVAAIADYANNYKVGDQKSLYDNFLRAGGEIGVGVAPDPGFCDSTLCNLLMDKLSASAWYKVLADTSQNHASVHNFTAQLAYDISGNTDSSGGKGLALTVQYTDGREDITLFKLPTWSVGFKGSL